MPDNEKPTPCPETPEPQQDPLEAERQIAKTFVSGTLQTLIRWMPIGGSAGMFLSFLLTQNWVMALLTFPATVVAVIWAAYTESFLLTLREVSKERGKQHANALMTWMKNLDETLKWQLAGTKKQYLKRQGDDCLHYTTEGAARTFKPLLKDVFVPLDLSGNFWRGVEGEVLPGLPGFKWDREIIERLQKDEGLRIWDILRRGKKDPGYRHLAIQAWGGYGKTTLLRHVTYIYTQKQRKSNKAPDLIPVLIYLRHSQHQILSDSKNLDLPKLIERHHIPDLPAGQKLKLPPNWVKNKLDKGEMLVMFDGLDEVREDGRDKVMEWIKTVIRKYHPSFFILTSRPSGYRSYANESKLNSIYVKPLNEAQQERFIQRWYWSRERWQSAAPNNPSVKQAAMQQAANLVSQLQGSPELGDLSKNPLLLNIIVNLHSCYSGEKLPTRRTELYREIVRMQLGDRPLVKKIDMILDAKESQKILQALALNMVRSNTPQIELQPLLGQLNTSLNDLGEDIEARQFLKQIEEVSELLVKRDRDYEFAHLSFQGYLAALEIQEQRLEPLLMENWEHSWWRETIILYATQLNPKQFSPFILELLRRDQKAVDLAYNCLKEYPKKVSDEVEAELRHLNSAVDNLRYQQLEDYLKNKQWKEADRETLRVMLQTVGKEENQWLDYEDIQDFPCEDLRKIDQLWVRYSSGRFGFSVQKQIYVECGARLDGKYPGDEIWYKFCDRIGWRQNGEWMNYDELTFSTSASQGHLPAAAGGGGRFAWMVVGDGGIVYNGRWIFSRAETCNL